MHLLDLAAEVKAGIEKKEPIGLTKDPKSLSFLGFSEMFILALRTRLEHT